MIENVEIARNFLGAYEPRRTHTTAAQRSKRVIFSALFLCFGVVAQAQTRTSGVSVNWTRSSRAVRPATAGSTAHADALPQFVVSTVVGAGKAGYTGDSGPAAASTLNEPIGVTVDGVGDLYIADYDNSVIRVVTPDGTIGTVAGTGRAGFSGDGGPATSAQLNNPTRVSIDAQGNLYVADAANNRVRKIAPDDTIITVAGNGHAGYAGDGGPALSAELDWPDDVVVDAAGNLYIVCNVSNVVRMVTPDGTISTVVGTGKAGFKGDGGPATSAELNSPTSVEVDITGDLLVTDQGNNRVRQVTNGIITTIAGDGKAGYTGDGGQGTASELHTPAGITLDGSGNLYIADRGNDVIRILFNDGTIWTVAGDGSGGFGGDGGTALQAQFNSPRKVAIAPSGVMYVADCFNNRIRLLLSTPAVDSGGVVSASAFGGFASVAPGSWIEIYGTNLASDTRPWAGSDFNGNEAPLSLDGTSVTIGGKSAFVDFISPGQVNALVPSDVPLGQQEITVTNPVGTSASYAITVNSAQAGLLAPSSFTVGGTQYVVALFPDGATYVLPPGAIPGVTSQRANPGDTITLYGVGFGPVTPNISAGQIVQQSNTLVNSFEISFGGQLATVSYSGLAPNYIGLYQFNVVVPNVAASDTVPVTFTLGSAASTQTLYVAVGN